MAAPGAFLLGVCALMLAIAVANAEAASVVVGLAKCADCTRKNMKAEEAFKGLKVAIKCKNVHGDYESKAVGGLDSTGAFSVPLAANLQGADCVAQLHSAASNTPCTGQEPSKVVPVSGGTTYGVVAGAKTATASPECASVTMCGPMKKHILEHFHHKKPVPPKPEPKPQPHPDYHPKPVPPKPEPKPQPHPDYHPVPPTPTYGGGGGHPSTPIYHAEPSMTVVGPIKKHILDHFHHKKPVPPKPEPKPQPHPDYHPVPPTPTYGGGHPSSSTPIYHAPAQH
ncbi:proline-rich protein 4-like [Lolium rigidum]|uniref:proline-rich protein 4-like n=1 Tax=Lolium rigidum TaxID=89674 RepID=UPI001F5D92DB|nr:proline-rich protein 4-like [Lolium rigidum]